MTIGQADAGFREEVRREIRRLRGATDDDLKAFSEELTKRRIAWYRRTGATMGEGAGSLDRAYHLLLSRLGIPEADAPIRSRDDRRIVFHSRNRCPTLEACRILRLDTRRVCRLSSESATDALVKQVDPGLRFRRNYERLRPGAAYCEEIIERET